jgi:hypothetical protein
MSDDEIIALRVSEIGGQRHADDFTVIWRCMPIGRIMRASGMPSDKAQYLWNCYLYGRPSSGDDSGTGDSLDDCKRRFRAAWARIRAGLTDEDIARAHRYAEASAEALVLHDGKGGK